MGDNLNKAIDYMMKRFEEVNTFFIEKVAEQIMAIGELNPTSINRIRYQSYRRASKRRHNHCDLHSRKRRLGGSW